MARSGRQGGKTNLEFIQLSDITQIAEGLGLQLDQKKTQPRRAICPFHDDNDPSLNLYRSNSSGGDRDHYHCFVCGAHGDALSLVQNFERLSFWDAVKRLAEIQGFELPEFSRSSVDKRSGNSSLSERIDATSLDDSEFVSFAETRGFSPEFIKKSGGGVVELRQLIDQAHSDRATEEKLVAAGLLRRSRQREDQPDLYGSSLQGFFYGKRIVFKVGDPQQGITGFIARSMNDSTPKYLYSYGFPRRSTLFGLDRVLSKLRNQPKSKHQQKLDVFLVEGIFDVLRLESLGHSAVGILGSRLSSGDKSQIERLGDLADSANQQGFDLKFRVFFDHDEAGRSGAYEAVIDLIKLLDSCPPFELDVIWVPGKVKDKSDPDALLKSVAQGKTKAFIDNASISALTFLASYRLGSDPHKLDLSTPSRMKLAAEARQIALSLGDISLSRAFGPLEIDTSDELLSKFFESIQSYSSRSPTGERNSQGRPVYSETIDDRAALLTALSIGRSSSLRHEYPLEDDAWERLAVAASPLFHLHRKRLELVDPPSAPFLSREVPKGDKRYRLKSGPVAEDSLLQQYILLELLRDRSSNNQFSERVPAIRYSSDEPSDGGIYRTGSTTKRRALSFAYQIDMEVVNGKTPPRREGIFRPYFECWRSFIDYIDDQIRKFEHENLQILRLDITGFYDHIRRDAVSDAIVEPLNDALNILPETTDGRHRFAPLLDPNGGKLPAKRAEIVTDFLLKHAFGCDVSDPKTGEILSNDQMIGIPQGPDLSAYLANVSLFGLDDLMEDEIKKLNENSGDLLPGEAGERVRASYARYVDDLVLVCPDIETAYHLRRKIETYLKNKGLSLNRKNATPPPMSRAEARGWLTDNRAGFGFSGPLAELPTTDAMDPLADAGEIDRKSALGLLYDPELDDPENVRKNLDKIQLALSAPDIRFGDRANAFKRLWCIAASEQESTSGTGLAQSFLIHLQYVEPFSLNIEANGDCLDLGLACLEGLEKALRMKVPKGVLSDARVEHFENNLRQLSKCVLDDVFKPLISIIFQGKDENELLSRHDVRSQIGITACLAAEKISSEVPICSLSKLELYFKTTSSHTLQPLARGLWLSLFKIDPSSVDAPPSLAQVGQDKAIGAFTKIYIEIVKLQRIAVLGPEEDTNTTSHAVKSTESAIEDLATLTNLILGVWSRSEVQSLAANVSEAHQVELDAAATFINITYEHFERVATGRGRLMQLIAGSSSAQPLPSPPGLETSGILLWSENKLLLATTEGVENSILGVDWIDHGATQVAGVKLRRADLPDGSRPLYSGGIKWTPGTISKIYRNYFPYFLDQIAEADRTDVLPVPTAFSFFANVKSGSVDLSSVTLVCWSATKESVDGHAFVRNGASLEARKVFSEGADYWRYGWAIRDLCERPDLLTDEEGGQDAQASTALAEKVHRREAMVARILPRLSGSDKWGAGSFTNNNLVPTRIDRALKLLESFDLSHTQELDAAYLISALTEGVFMSDRINKDPDLTIPGKTAIQILNSVKRLSRGLPEAAKLWGAIDLSSPVHLRRSARAWSVLGKHVQRNIPDDGAQQALETLVLGLDITAVVAELRALAFELSSLLLRSDIEQLSQSKFELSWLNKVVGPYVLLFDRGGLNPNSDVEHQVELLLSAFTQIILNRSINQSAIRDMISPVGWVVILAVILQVLPVREDPLNLKTRGSRPKLWRMTPDKLAKVKDHLVPLLTFLSAKGTDDSNEENWPWQSFDALSDKRPKNLVDDLKELTELTSLEVKDEISPVNPRTGESQTGKSIMRLADGTSHALSDWQVDIAHILGERGTATETLLNPELQQLNFQYSVTRLGAKVVGVHMVSRQLSEVSLQNTQHSLTDDNAPEETSQTGINSQRPTRAKETVTVQLDDRANEEPISSTNNSSNGILRELKEKQLKAWQKRSMDKSLSLRRLAIVQWDVAETYYQPTYKNGKYEGLLINGKVPTAGGLVGNKIALSTTEFRRRKILERVLEACLAFGVEGIVLPEYSVRPETVNWLTRRIRAAGKPIIVWCGTFRVPSGTQIDQLSKGAGNTVPFALASIEPTPAGRLRWDFHAALLTCLRGSKSDQSSEIQVEHFVRQKRYPSAAAGEMIRPPISEAWHPLLSDVTDPFDLGTYALELICAEMFPHASSSNFVGVLHENIQLLKGYNAGIPTPNLLDSLNEDIHTFAKWTAYRSAAKIKGHTNQTLNRGKRLQRTLIILPAMTSRTADYHIFGQNQYLAAGLVTAFCNAVTPHISRGQSAFVGLNGWTTTEGSETPYGTQAPGIFQLGKSDHSGPLGKNEAAVVIADLDLTRTTDQKPRPHYQSRPLGIVAHLPLVFATETGVGSEQTSYPHGNRKDRVRPVGLQNVLSSFEDAVHIINDAFEADSQVRPFLPQTGANEAADVERGVKEEKIRKALKMLEVFVDDPIWMEKRTKSFEDQRLDFPPEIPLPALLDWLYIDDRWQPEIAESFDIDELTEPMTSDLPLLSISTKSTDDPKREPD